MRDFRDWDPGGECAGGTAGVHNDLLGDNSEETGEKAGAGEELGGGGDSGVNELSVH